MTDLSLVSIEDLADELMKRSKAGIIHLHDIKDEQGYFNWTGDYYTCLGLCADLMRIISEEGLPEDDDD
jgi:hypothetical protein